MTKVVLGKLYQKLLHEQTGGDPEKVNLFATGFIAGQAETVFNGIRRAMMVRPSAQNYDMVLSACRMLAEHYKLAVSIFVVTDERSPEIWMHRKNIRVGEWREHDVNSPEWHKLRAAACGIPTAEVDVTYHLREGFDEPCD